jgi:hypothetical protein
MMPGGGCGADVPSVAALRKVNAKWLVCHHKATIFGVWK